MVYLATDPDREGEAIAWHLKELLDLPDDKACRVTFNEITKQRGDREHRRAHGTSTSTLWTPSRRAASSTG